MEPQIRYARTSDGASIAWHALGSGPAYIWPATAQAGGIAEQMRVPELRALFENIATRATLIVYDPRGFGLSDRSATDFSLEAAVRDLEAVADAAAPRRFTLQAFGYMSMPGLAYAAEHPDRLYALIMLNGVLRGADLASAWARVVRIAREDWSFATALLARTNEASYSSTATLEQLEELVRRNVTPEAFGAFAEAMAGWDASDAAAKVETPALVLHYGGPSPYVSADACRRLAAALPRGTLVALEATSDPATRINNVWNAVLEFLGGGRGAHTPAAREQPSETRPGTAVILFADIADSTAITERLGDDAFRAASRALDAAMRSAIRDAGGTPVEGKVLGDGVMGVHTSAAEAIRAARAFVGLSAATELQLHIGLHAGDVTREGGNVYGGAVNIASRICGLSAPGEILVSQTVRDLARTSSDVRFEERGEQELRGVADSIRLYCVRERDL